MLNTDLKFGEVYDLASQIANGSDRVEFKRVFETANGGVTLLAFKAGQKLEEHQAPAEVMVYVLEGEIEFTMMGTPHVIESGRFLLMGADVPHSVVAKADTKVALIKVKP
ncbi:MAG: cupin domain-containing protein [Bacteroides sp.]|nr:cupin domain-containing protein [Bacteroides sp.]MCM1413913.1 cupin domain-containing protein [Bacteroides sp.]